MRKSLTLLALLVVVIASSAGFVGCSTLLGDFEVSTSSPTPGQDGGDATVCTQCNGQCVDIAADSKNCGACGTVCPGDQTCQMSACKCPLDKAFCGGACVVADRQHCGASCGACQSDEICSGGCTAAPAPTFEKTPLETTGWTDPAGAPITFTLKATGSPGTIYECRTGPAAAFTPTDPPWKACDGAMGDKPKHAPKPDATTPEGSYRTEYRYRSDTYRSPTATFLFYAHHSLDKVATCPRPGQAADGPHFTDAQYFAAAVTYSGMFPGTFSLADAFPVPGAQPADPMFLRNPFIKIPFTGVKTIVYEPTWPLPTAPAFDHTVNERSLRHKYVLNPTRTMLLVRRQYVNPVKKDCKNSMEFGSQLGRQRGPIGRGPHSLDCEAFIITVHGLGLCMGKNAAGTAPAPQVVDQRVHSPGFFGNPGANTVNGNGNPLNLVASAGTNVSFMANRWIFVSDVNNNRWYKVTAVAGQVLTLADKLVFPVTVGSAWKYSNVTTNPQDVFLVPTGFSHLYQDGKNWATHGPNFNPSYNTKCETPGCAAGKPWMTYLPP